MRKIINIVFLMFFINSICFSNDFEKNLNEKNDVKCFIKDDLIYKNEYENKINDGNLKMGVVEITGGALIALAGTGAIIVGSTFPECSNDTNARPFSNIGPCGSSPALIFSGAGLIIVGTILIYFGIKNIKK